MSNIGLATSQSSQLLKDPRPIRDKSFIANSIRSLINFLVQAGYNQPVSQKTLQAPSAKDFQNIFKFLYSQLDQGFVFVKKFEEEVPPIMKGIRYIILFLFFILFFLLFNTLLLTNINLFTGLFFFLSLSMCRYPFADSISKSHLYSVGSMHAWPSMLAMLNWMVELILVSLLILQNTFSFY